MKKHSIYANSLKCLYPIIQVPLRQCSYQPIDSFLVMTFSSPPIVLHYPAFSNTRFFLCCGMLPLLLVYMIIHCLKFLSLRGRVYGPFPWIKVGSVTCFSSSICQKWCCRSPGLGLRKLEAATETLALETQTECSKKSKPVHAKAHVDRNQGLPALVPAEQSAEASTNYTACRESSNPVELPQSELAISCVWPSTKWKFEVYLPKVEKRFFLSSVLFQLASWLVMGFSLCWAILIHRDLPG
jgi:hypothetical protein